MVIRGFAYRKIFVHVLDHCDIATIFGHLQLIVELFTPTYSISVLNSWYSLVEIPRFFTNVIANTRNDRRNAVCAQGHECSLLRVTEKSTPGCLRLEMDRSV